MTENPIIKKQRRSMIANQIRETRQRKGLTQEQLAEKAEVTSGLLCHYETGHTEPSLRMLIRLCDAMGCSVDHLLGREVDYSTMTPLGRMRGIFLRLPSEVQEMIIQMMEGIKI